MAISFDKKRKLFHLTNNKISYYFFVNEKNILQHLYFGSYLDDINIESITNLGWDWSKTYLEKDTNIEKFYQDNYYSDRSLTEMASHGVNDKKGAPIIINHKDNSNLTDLRYKSHRIYKGKPRLSNLPHTFLNNDFESDSLEIVLGDIKDDIEVILTFTIFNNLNVIARNTTIKNNSSDEIRVRRAYSLQLDLPHSNYDLYHFHGDWCLERQISKQRLADGLKRISSNFGRSSHEENPFAILASPNANEDEGEAIGFSFVYSGNFAIDVNVDKWKTTRVMMGIKDEDFEIVLGKDESFVTPEGLIIYSNSGIGELSRTLHDLIRNNLIRSKYVHAKRPILFNSWEGCYFDFNTEVICEYIKDAKKIGTELFVLDDGWFGTRDDDTQALGDWYINKEKVDLNKIIKTCHDLDIKFGIWFEPEMINPNSKLFKEHPEFALGYKEMDRSLSRHQLVLDTSNKKAVDNIFEQMCEILDNYDIDYVKWDHNRWISDIYTYHLDHKYQGEIYHRLMLGSYDLMERLCQRYPNILFEGCASGGGRFDLGILYYAPQIWTSDETDPVQRLFIQYSTSMAYPLSSMGAHVSKNPITSYKTKADIALFGTYGYEFDPRKLTQKDIDEVNEVADIYHKYHHEVIQNGDLYRLYSPYETNYMSMMSVSKDKSKALILFANILKENNRYRYLKLKGIDQDKYYWNSFDNKVHKGDYYLNVGLNLTRWLDEFTSFLIILEERESYEEN